MVVQVLVVPHDFAGVGVQRERRVVIEVLVVDPAQSEFRRGRGDRGPDVDQVQFGVEAGHHPGADVPTVLERHVSPRLVAGFAWPGNQPSPPELLTGDRVVGGNDAGVWSPGRHAAAPGDDLAVGNDRPGGLRDGVATVVQYLGVPEQLSGPGGEREDVAISAGVDDGGAVDGEISICVHLHSTQMVGQVVRALPAVLPEQVAGRRVDGLNDVAGVGHVEHAVTDQWGPLLQALGQTSRPDHPEVAHVGAIDLLQRAVAPTVECTTPHQPVSRIWVLQFGVRDGCDGALACLSQHGPRPLREQRHQDGGTRYG